jgi:hypothetical protein
MPGKTGVHDVAHHGDGLRSFSQKEVKPLKIADVDYI